MPLNGDGTIFIMTLKKINISSYNFNAQGINKGQSIFEYYIVVAVVMTAFLVFTTSSQFVDIKSYCEEAFYRCVNETLL